MRAIIKTIHFRAAKARRAFTLTEIAIVLSIVGLIAAGVFVAGSAAQNHIQLNQGSDELNLIAGNMRSLYSGQNTAGVTTSTAFPDPTLTLTLVTQGVFPNETLSPAPVGKSPPCQGAVANNPWSFVQGSCNGGTTGGSILMRLIAGNPPQFAVRYTGIPPDVCINLVVNNSLPGSETKLRKIVITGASSTPYAYTTDAQNQLPVTPSNAATACASPAAATDTFTIDWYYDLGT